MTNNKKIIIGSDHGGFKLKEIIKEHLSKTGFSVDDEGCYSNESCNYPEFARKVSMKVSEGKGRGILICGTGIGMSITANRIPGVRAALCHDGYTAKMSRKHNDANILVLGARATGDGAALDILDSWLQTEFEGGRHATRIEMIDKA